MKIGDRVYFKNVDRDCKTYYTVDGIAGGVIRLRSENQDYTTNWIDRRRLELDGASSRKRPKRTVRCDHPTSRG